MVKKWGLPLYQDKIIEWRNQGLSSRKIQDKLSKECKYPAQESTIKAFMRTRAKKQPELFTSNTQVRGWNETKRANEIYEAIFAKPEIVARILEVYNRSPRWAALLKEIPEFKANGLTKFSLAEYCSRHLQLKLPKNFYPDKPINKAKCRILENPSVARTIWLQYEGEEIVKQLKLHLHIEEDFTKVHLYVIAEKYRDIFPRKQRRMKARETS